MQKLIRVDDSFYEFLPGSAEWKSDQLRFTCLTDAQRFARHMRRDFCDMGVLRTLLADYTLRLGVWQLRPEEFDNAFANALARGQIKVRHFRLTWSELQMEEVREPNDIGKAAGDAAKPDPWPAPGGPPLKPPIAPPGPLSPLGPPSLPGVLAAVPAMPAIAKPDLAALIPANPLAALLDALPDLDAIKADFLDLRIEIDQTLVQTFSFQTNMDFATAALGELPGACASVTKAMNAAAAEVAKTMGDL